MYGSQNDPQNFGAIAPQPLTGYCRCQEIAQSETSNIVGAWHHGSSEAAGNQPNYAQTMHHVLATKQTTNLVMLRTLLHAWLERDAYQAVVCSSCTISGHSTPHSYEAGSKGNRFLSCPHN